jgi:hypothetical protein
LPSPICFRSFDDRTRSPSTATPANNLSKMSPPTLASPAPSAALPRSSPHYTPTDYGCFNKFSASNFPPRAFCPLAGIRNYVSTVLILAKDLQRTIFFRDTLAELS